MSFLQNLEEIDAIITQAKEAIHSFTKESEKKAEEVEAQFESDQLRLIKARHTATKEIDLLHEKREELVLKEKDLCTQLEATKERTIQKEMELKETRERLFGLEQQKKADLVQSSNPVFPFFPLHGWIAFPRRPIQTILNFLPPESIVVCERLVCHRWKSAIGASLAWKSHLEQFRYEFMDDSHLFHCHMLFGLKLQPDNSCLFSIEQVPVPNQIDSCKNMTIRERRAENNGILARPSDEIQIPSTSGLAQMGSLLGFGNKSSGDSDHGIVVEICDKDAGHLGLERKFCNDALNWHRKNLRYERMAHLVEARLLDLEKSKRSLSDRLAALEGTLNQKSKDLMDVRTQNASDGHTILFLESHRDSLIKSFSAIESDLDSISKKDFTFREESELKLRHLNDRQKKLQKENARILEQLKQQILVLAKEVKNLRNEAETVERDVVFYKEKLKSR